MKGHNGLPNGVIQCFNFNNNISRLQARKLYATRKFFGSCLDNVNYMSQNLEIITGAMRRLSQTGDVLDETNTNVTQRNKDANDLGAFLRGIKQCNDFYIEQIDDLGPNEFINYAKQAAIAANAAAE